MYINLSNDEYNILKAGCTFLFTKDSSLTFDLVFDSGYSMNITLKFIENPNENQRILVNTDNNSVVLLCINFVSDGTGLAAPTRIACVDDKDVYIQFWSRLEGNEQGKESSRIVYYTFFQDKEISKE